MSNKFALLLAICLFGIVFAYPPQRPTVRLWGCDQGSLNQQFSMDKDGFFHLEKLPQKCLEVEKDGTWFVIRCDPHRQEQKFVYDKDSFVISNEVKDFRSQYNAVTRRCLTATVEDAKRESYGTNVLFKPCDGSDRQQWTIDDTKNTIRPREQTLSNLCLDYYTTWQCDQTDSLIAKYPFCNRNLTFEERAIDLVARMTPEEKSRQMMNIAPGIPRLGVSNYDYWSEALHGVMSSQDPATMFPQVIGLGASFNQSMYKAIGQVISTEARALANQGIQGLTYWSPNINIFRDPRWGRGQETPGEDPFLSSRYAVNFVQGMQEGDKKYTKVVATCKHYAAYSLESWNKIERYGFDAKVDQQDLDETYLPAFRACVVEGKAKSIMCSYNAVNGAPACANDYLLKQKLRDEWKFDGYVVSDCDAVANIYDPHHYKNTTWESTSVAVRAGTDLDCGGFYGHIPEAITRGLLTDRDLTTAVERLFTQRMALGMFDRASNPFEKIKMDEIDSSSSRQLSLQAARESMVLLKNHNGALPLNRAKINSIAVIGPNADDAGVLWGNYYGMAPFTVTPLQGIKKAFKGNVTYAKGCAVTGDDSKGIADAVNAARAADVTVLFIGINQEVEAEGRDRYNITLTGVQPQLVQQVIKAANGKPVIIVLINGGPLDITDLRDNDAVGGILEAWYGGQSAGTAIAEALFGDYNPGGVLPVTFYPQKYVSLIPLTDMNMRPYPGRTYKYLQIEPVWRFGFGLSYTSFEVFLEGVGNVLDLYRPIRHTLRVYIKNTGTRDGDYVALAFAKSVHDDYISQYGSLFAFERVHVRAGQTNMIELSVTEESFARFRKGELVTAAEDFVITITGTMNSNTIDMKVKVF